MRRKPRQVRLLSLPSGVRSRLTQRDSLRCLARTAARKKKALLGFEDDRLDRAERDERGEYGSRPFWYCLRAL